MYAAASLLAQTRPANTTAATAFAATRRTEITRILVCNTTGTAATCRLHHDDDGTTYDQSTALFYDYSISANTTLDVTAQIIGGGITISAGGSLGVRTGTNDALTFSVYGVPAVAP